MSPMSGPGWGLREASWGVEVALAVGIISPHIHLHYLLSEGEAVVIMSPSLRPPEFTMAPCGLSYCIRILWEAY